MYSLHAKVGVYLMQTAVVETAYKTSSRATPAAHCAQEWQLATMCVHSTQLAMTEHASLHAQWNPNERPHADRARLCDIQLPVGQNAMR
jgi:hypothetical protein